jgi:hypothetical protein
MPKYVIPRLSDILFLSLLIVVICFGPRTFNLDGDIGRHITIGEYIIDHMSIPRIDLFSHTMIGQPITPHEWLAQVFFALAHRILNMSGVVLLAAVMISATFSIVYYDSLKRTKAPIISLTVVLIAAASSSLHWLARPHIFTFLYLSVWSLLLDRKRKGERVPLWIFGAVMLIWANTHGAYIAGFVTWGAYLAGVLYDIWKSRSMTKYSPRSWYEIGIVSFLVTLINPAGIDLWKTSLSFISNQYLVSHTQEYLPPDFHSLNNLPFLLLIAMMILLLSIRKKPLPSAHGILLAGWTIMGLYSARNIPLFAIVAAPILSQSAAEIAKNSFWGKRENRFFIIEQRLLGFAWIILGILISAWLMFLPSFQAYNAYDKSRFPVEAIDWLDNHPQEGYVFNYFSWGGYLLYRKWPETLVFIDGQTDFYGEKLTREYESVIVGNNGWEQILEKYSVTWIIIPKSSSLAATLQLHPGWKISYQDNTSIIANLVP